MEKKKRRNHAISYALFQESGALLGRGHKKEDKGKKKKEKKGQRERQRVGARPARPRRHIEADSVRNSREREKKKAEEKKRERKGRLANSCEHNFGK